MTASDSFSDSAILQVFDALIFQQSGEGFVCRGELPSWCPPPGARSLTEFHPEVLLTQSFFLQHVLQEAQSWWASDQSGVWKSGLWSEPDVFGEEAVFEAIAVREKDIPYLIIQRFGPDMVPVQPLLQKAREEQLSHRQSLQQHEQREAQLGSQLARSEQERDDVMAVLDRLGLGTILVDATDRITFISRTAQDLLQREASDIIGHSLQTGLPWPKEFSALLHAQEELPDDCRGPASVVLDRKGAPSLSLDIEMRDDPRDPLRKILFLKDVTEVHELRRQLVGQTHFFRLIGKSPAMRAIYEQIQDVAMVDAPVLIQGETGTGKELVARALHEGSPRKDRPFVAVNCAGLTDSLLGSQLFGHKRGAFTGAIQDHEGFFEAADGGTLLLDEIGDMPLPIQTTLLRVLQEGEIIRLGESRPRSVNVRVLAATHQDLQALVQAGRFRSDLLYRIRVARLRLPALRERREDIPLLSMAFLEQGRAAIGKLGIHDIAPTAMQQLLRYPWPGNVRELKAAVEFALIHCRGTNIQPSDLPPEFEESGHPVLSHPSPVAARDERQAIMEALQQVNGRRIQAAKLLGMSRSTFYRRLRELDIPIES